MSSSTSYQEILDNNPIAIIAFDSNYLINYANNAANRLAELIKEKSTIVGVGLSELGFDDIQISPTSNSNNQKLINQMGTLQIIYSSLPDSGFVAELTELDSTSELSTQAIQKVIQKISQGEFSARLQSDKFRKQDQQESEFMNECFDKIEEAIENLFHDINLMADCNFSEPLKTKENGILSDFFTKLTTTGSNLNEALKQTFEFTKIIEKASSEIAADNQVLAKGTHKQTTELIETVASIEELSSAVAHTSQNASSASQLAQSTNHQIKAGQVTVKDMVSAMSAVESSSSKIESIVSVINDIAFQTRILSLNAAVEAARVGDYGRGFAVVAEEVRSLAQRSADAAKEIKKLIYESSEIVQEGKKLAGQVHVQMEQIVSGMDETNQLMQEISTATDEQSKGIELSNSAISNIDAITQKNQSLVKQLNKNTANLDQQVKYLVDTSNIFYLRDDAKGFSHPRHDLAIKIAQDGADSLSKVLQETFDKGGIDLESLFDQDYQAIDNTAPQKFSTRFDRLTDKVFPPIQESILDLHEFVVLACGIDVNGYIPTHNKRFSLPLTGDKEKDLVGNRTKRIFDDRVGLLSGRATKPYTIQTYRRDTGELMFDVSAPISVAGKHWGGIRIGYRLD